MLGFILIFFIGKYFYQLAEEYQQNKWLYAIIGVVSYYVGTFIAGILIGILYVLIANDLSGLENTPDIVLSLMALPFGLLSCWGLYTILKKQWKKNIVKPENEIAQIGIEPDPEDNAG